MISDILIAIHTTKNYTRIKETTKNDYRQLEADGRSMGAVEE
jgi:hypothetical protein